MRTLPLLATLALASLAGASMPTRAETFNTCTGFITSLPATITTQGVWCFNANLDTAITSGSAITIATNNVTIDCNDFKLGGLQAGAGTVAHGIFANNRLNATVRHCSIRGFYYGIGLFSFGGGGHLVEDNRFDGNTYVGLFLAGDGSLIQRNRVNTTGGSTVAAGTATGIRTAGIVDILDNSVDGVAPSADVEDNGTATGIFTFQNSGSLIGNRVRGVAPLGIGASTGIDNNSSGRISLRRNDVVGPGTIAISCNDNQGSAQDNIMNGFTTGLSACTNDGGNVIK